MEIPPPEVPSSERNDSSDIKKGKQDTNLNVEELGLPWHHVQLYRLYGNEADYFLYPKLSTEKVKGTHYTSNKPPKVSGNLGASSLWTKLRSDSNSKLTAKQARQPTELQSSYRSFVREFVTTEQRKGRKDIYSTNDVPDLPKLVDHKLHDRILDRRQTTQVMWRASRKNEDNTTILIHNSPLYHAILGSGTERVQQYLIQSHDQPDEICSRPPESNATQETRGREIPRGRPGDNWKLVYFTDRDLVSSGAFSQKHTDSHESSQLLTSLTGIRSSFGMDTSGTPEKLLHDWSKPRRKSQVKPRATTDSRYPRPTMTLSALLDYELPPCPSSQKYSRQQSCL